ncbi:NADH-quinone oxidoreductase subunit C [Paenibacillus methanolicus]|uniref:NADH-quinone oxidoreductase subunit C n=1 Tax=Paenibacillus methanolicus TaxID=582686 RepID=UPI001FE6EA6E|nr:NADH-quinone oxidoreductase subunit C [Paenibacillus methanolicus]
MEHREADQETAEARAARAATKAATEGGAASPPAPADPEREAKLAAAAEAPAARAAAKAAAEGEAAGPPAPADPEREAKLAVAAEARAARAAAKAAAEGGTPSAASGSAEQPPAATSPRQPELDGLVALIRDAAGPDAIESATLNELNGDLPTIIVQSDHLTAAANALKSAPQTRFTYLRNVSGVDYETHLEVVYHLVSLTTGRDAAIKVKADREQPQIPSVTPIWATANWNEREIYDLLGIHFTGHPDLRRIMMPDDWEGHPLRKDYAPLDPEV